MTRRLIYEVRWSRPHGCWQMIRRGRPVLLILRNRPPRLTKAQVVRWAADYCRMSWRNEGQLAQLVVRGRSGRIQFERTYGKDPRRRKG